MKLISIPCDPNLFSFKSIKLNCVIQRLINHAYSAAENRAPKQGIDLKGGCLFETIMEFATGLGGFAQ